MSVIRCAKCNALLMLVRSGAVCSSFDCHGPVRTHVARNAIRKAWQMEGLPLAVAVIHYPEAQFRIGHDNAIYVRVHSLLEGDFLDAKYDDGKQLRKGRFRKTTRTF